MVNETHGSFTCIIGGINTWKTRGSFTCIIGGINTWETQVVHLHVCVMI